MEDKICEYVAKSGSAVNIAVLHALLHNYRVEIEEEIAAKEKAKAEKTPKVLAGLKKN